MSLTTWTAGKHVWGFSANELADDTVKDALLRSDGLSLIILLRNYGFRTLEMSEIWACPPMLAIRGLHNQLPRAK